VFNGASCSYRNCTVRNNWAYLGAGSADFFGDVTYTHCLFYNNEGSIQSSALRPGVGSSTLTNCVIAENTGHSAMSAVTSLTLNNCIFWNNGTDLACEGSALVNVNNTLLQEGTLPACAIDGGGNIYGEDPLFEDVLNHNFRLTETSPAVNSGNNSLVTSALDFDKDNRIFQNFVDLGAFERQCPDGTTPTTLIVTNPADGEINSFKNLVEQFACPGDTIMFDPALNGIPLMISGDQIDMTKGVIVIGNGVDSTIIDGGESTRILRIYGDITAELSEMTFRHGKTTGNGGAVYSEGIVSISRCLFTANDAIGTSSYYSHLGGAIYVADGNFTGSHLVITGNRAQIGGGFTCGGGAATLYHCTIAGNYAALVAGGASFYPAGDLTLYNCVVWGNYAAAGGFNVNFEPARDCRQHRQQGSQGHELDAWS
jgi:predicted outer membrane repeat protein